MANEGGYDRLVADILRDFQADGVFIIVFGGTGGTGSAWGAGPSSYIAVRAHLPDILRKMADAIEANNKPEPAGAKGN